MIVINLFLAISLIFGIFFVGYIFLKLVLGYSSTREHSSCCDKNVLKDGNGFYCTGCGEICKILKDEDKF